MINFQTHLHLALFRDHKKWNYYMMILVPTDNTDKLAQFKSVLTSPFILLCLWRPHILYLSYGSNHRTHRGMTVANRLVISEMGKQDEVPHSVKLLKNNLFWLSVSDEVIQKCFIYDTNMRQETRVFTGRERELTPSQLSEWTVCVSPEKPIKLSSWYIITNKPNEVNSDT